MHRRNFLQAAAGAPLVGAPAPAGIHIENQHYSLDLDPASGSLSSLLVKRNSAELIGEKRLLANFRICLPLPDYQCNYVEGVSQKPAKVERRADGFFVAFSGLDTSRGRFPLDLTYTISLREDQVVFRASLTNRSEYPVSEFWFPRIGGWTSFGNRDARLATPNYSFCRHDLGIFRRFPAGRGFGSEAAEFTQHYPGLCMPWWELYDEKSDTGLYLGYHDKTFRFSTWHLYLMPDVSGEPGENWLTSSQAAGQPVGMVFSHVRFPFIKSGETFDTGEFILRVHQGDWHAGSLFYRDWFLRHFPFDKSSSWLRKETAWFSSIIYQPDEKIIADYKTYDQWCRDAEQYGIRCHELIGWDKGGLERDYPEYIPEEKLGGREGYRALQRSIKSRGSRCLTFVNYNILDSATDLYRRELKPYTHQDQYGNTPNGMAWGESTLIARKSLSVHRHVLSSVIPPIKKLLEGHFLNLVRDGADGFQIDKTVAGHALDFNPMNTRKPDEALCEGLIEAIGEVYEKCRRTNPEFRLASEHREDRYLPYVDVAYRACQGYNISPLRYVFPEWTAVQHVGSPRAFRAINGAVLTGAVICVEPHNYQGSLADPLYRELAEYIREVGRLRAQFASIIFLGKFLDTVGATVSGKDLHYAVHEDPQAGRRALVVANDAAAPRTYTWQFAPRAALHAPFQQPRTVSQGQPLEIPAAGLHILVAS